MCRSAPPTRIGRADLVSRRKLGGTRALLIAAAWLVGCADDFGDQPRSDSGVADDGDAPTDASVDGSQDASDASTESGGSGGSAGAIAFTISEEETFGALESSSATSLQRLLDVASRPGEHMAVFLDAREEPQRTLVASRVTSSGTVLDPLGIRLPGHPWTAEVAASPSGYVVVWTECEGPGGFECRSVEAAYVEGTTVQHAVLESSSVGEFHDPHVAFDGSQFVVLWRFAPADDSGIGAAQPIDNSETHGIRLGPKGKPIDPKPVTLPGVPSGALAASGQALLAGWLDGKGVQAARIHTTPALKADPPVVLSPFTLGDVRLAYGGGVFLALWWKVGEGLVAARLNDLGEPLDVPPIAIGTVPSGIKYHYDVGFHGGLFRVTWVTQDSTNGVHERMRTISPSGAVSPDVIAFPDAQQLSFSSDGSSLAFFGTTRSVPEKVARLFSGIDDGSQPLKKAPLSSYSNAQRELALIAGGAGPLAIWSDAKDDQRRIVVAQSSNESSPHWSTNIATTPAGNGWLSPAVARSSAQIAVAWIEPDEVQYEMSLRAARLDTSGSALDAMPVLLAKVPASGVMNGTFACESELDAASNGADYLFAYRFHWCNAGFAPKVCAMGLTSAGVASDRGCTEGIDPAVVAVGSVYFVAWSRYDYGIYSYILQGKLLTAGQSLGGNGKNIAYSDSGAFDVRLASDGKNVLAVWRTNAQSTGGPPELRAALVEAASGQFEKASFTIATDPHFGHAAVAFDGARYWIVWEEPLAAPSAPNVRALTLDLLGNPTGPAMTLSVPQISGDLRAAASKPGEIFIGYSRFDDILGSLRAHTRRWAL